MSTVNKKYDPKYLFPFIYCLAFTGARRNEVTGLKWPDIDLSEAYITFRQTKNGTDRIIKMDPKLHKLLKSRLGLPSFVN